MDTCKTSRWWVVASQSVGYCYRFPPTVNTDGYAKNPQTMPNHFCGEHTPRKESE